MTTLPKLDQHVDKPMITATTSFQLLIQASADITDDRERYETAGHVADWMTDYEAIAWVLTFLLKADFEHDVSPRIMTALLQTYCPAYLASAFVNYYCLVMKQSDVIIEAEALTNNNIDVLIDVAKFAKSGQAVGWQQRWGIFKEPYQSEWCAAFQS